jgi:hypothetical protein
VSLAAPRNYSHCSNADWNIARRTPCFAYPGGS